MPELAEVEYYRKQWTPAIGQRVVGVELHADKRIFRGQDTDALRSGLKGQALQRAEAHGKQMAFVFGDCHWLGLHLGMTGKTRIESADYEPGKHDHLVLRMQSGDQLIFIDPRLFGRVLYAACKSGEPDWWQGLPPGILSDAFTRERMNAFLKRRARSPIKAVLLMQEAFPGVGNWMADEILWRSRICPATRAGDLDQQQTKALYRRLREVCRDALRVIGTDWSRPPDSWLFNHRWKDGGVCPKTGCPLIREPIGGRTTCWSPKWQNSGAPK